MPMRPKALYDAAREELLRTPRTEAEAEEAEEEAEEEEGPLGSSWRSRLVCGRLSSWGRSCRQMQCRGRRKPALAVVLALRLGILACLSQL